MKKVIEQDFFLYIGDIEVSTDSDGDIEVLQWNKNREGGCDIVTVGKSKAREVALSICPELGEPTIKTDNTKVILHLESELEKQNEIYKGLKELGHERITKLESELKEAVELIELYIEKSTHRENGMIYVNDFELFEKFNTFLTKHKSKE